MRRSIYRGMRRRRSKGKYFACLFLLLLAVFAFVVYVWQPFNKGPAIAKDGGATIAKVSAGESDEEVRARLNKQVQDSVMTLSVSSKCEINDGKVNVNVVNDEGNKVDQSFELSQNGKVLYSSGLISPGESVLWCDAPDAVPGDANITIFAHNNGSKEAYGNAQGAKVTLFTLDE